MEMRVIEPTDKEKLYKIIATIFDLPEDLSRYMIPLGRCKHYRPVQSDCQTDICVYSRT